MVGWKRAVCVAAASMLGMAGVAAPATAGMRTDRPGGVAAAEVQATHWEYLSEWAYSNAGEQLVALIRCTNLGEANLDIGAAYNYECRNFWYGDRGKIELWVLVR